MAVRIGHASIDERNKAKGGVSGDQTGKEVKISNWYNGNWAFVARPKTSLIAEKIAKTCEDGCNNPNIGYDQNQRNTLNTQAKKVGYDISKITTPCETDCSAFVSVCVLASGVKIEYSSNLPTTSNLKTKLANTGAFDIITDEKYLNSSKYLLRGDILVRPAGHTVIVLDDGEDYNEEKKEPALYNVKLPVAKKGMVGNTVKALQSILIGFGYSCGDAGIDGDFGSGTERALLRFQKDNGLETDAKCGPKTWAKLLGV